MTRFVFSPRPTLAILGATLLAACAAQPAPVVVAPPPPIPARPLPPAGAVASLVVPPLDAYGVRQSVDAYLSPAQKVWNLRAALDVSARLCVDAKYEPVRTASTALRARHAKALAEVDQAVAAEFKGRYRAAYPPIRDAYAAQVYAYFALPGATPGFCDAALAVAGESSEVPTEGLEAFAAQALPRLDAPFEAVFRSFDRYRAAAAAWDARYARQPAPPTPPPLPLLQPGAPLPPPAPMTANGAVQGWPHPPPSSAAPASAPAPGGPPSGGS